MLSSRGRIRSEVVGVELSMWWKRNRLWVTWVYKEIRWRIQTQFYLPDTPSAAGFLQPLPILSQLKCWLRQNPSVYHPHLNFWSQIWTLDCFSVTVLVFPTHIKWFSDKGIAHVSGASVKLWNTPSMAGQLFLLQSSSRSEKSKDWDKILNTLMVCGRYLIKMDTVLLMEKRHDKWKWPVAKHCITCNSIYTKCPEEANSQRESEICVGGAVFFFQVFPPGVWKIQTNVLANPMDGGDRRTTLWTHQNPLHSTR